MPIIRFRVIGQPATQGSKKVVPIYRKGGVPVLKDGRVLTRAINDNPRTSQWRQEVAHAARQVYDGPLIRGPVALSLVFYRPRPKCHYGMGRNAGKLKPSAEQHPLHKPDLLKLSRAIEDALSKVVWRDDSQVVTIHAEKRWGEFFCVDVRIEVIGGDSGGSNGVSAEAAGCAATDDYGG